MNSGTPARVKAGVVAAVAVLWLLVVNALFFGQRVADSALVRRILERLGAG